MRRREFLSTAAVAAGTMASGTGRAATGKPVQVRVIASSPEAFDFVSWRLWDPWFLAVGIPQITPAASPAECDLLIIADRVMDRKGKRAPDLAAHIERARGVVAVQPAALGSPLPEPLASRFGVRFRKWHYETPRYSLTTEHRALGHLARSGGRSVMVHLPFEWHMEVEPNGAQPLTVFPQGYPEIFVHQRTALITSNAIAEYLQYHRHPEIWEYEADLAAIYVNLARMAAGAEPVTVPLPKLYKDYRLHFYGYAFGRKFIHELMALKGDDAVSDRIQRSDELIARAAAELLSENLPEMRQLYREAAEGLVACRKALTPVQPYFVRGWHGGLLDNRVVEGELIGYAEWGWPSRTMRWMEDRLNVSERLGYKQINQVNGQTWEQVVNHGLTDVERWKKASATGLIESVKGMYSDAYLEVLGAESNIRQFEYGLKALERMSNRVRTFMVATDDYAFHPQLPQILRGFGFDYAVLRPGGPGRNAGIDREMVLWQGLDGTTIPSVAHHKNVPWSRVAGYRGGINGMPEMLVAAEIAGFRTFLGGGAVDATLHMYGEREFESLNSVAPVQAVPVTHPEYCQAAALDAEPHFFGADDLQGYPDFWSGFGQINEACHDDRYLDRLLTTAEKFSTIAMQKGRPYPQASLEQAWKHLLSSQDHFTWGCGGSDNPEGYHVGGLQENGMRGYNGPRTPITTEETNQRWKRSAESAAKAALEGALETLCSAAPSSGDVSGSLIVYNGLNWEREGVVQAWVKMPPDARAAVAFDGRDERPAVILDRRSGEALVAFRARVPSLGFKAYGVRAAEPANAPADSLPTRLENRFLRVELNPESGAIGSVFDKGRGKELLRKSEQARFLCAYPEVDTARARAQVKLERLDALAKRIAVTGEFGHCPYRLHLTLEHESPWLEVDLEIDYGRGAIFGYKMKPDSLLRAAFPFAQGTRWINLPFGVYKTTLKHAATLDFCDAFDGASGVALINDGLPGLHLPDGNLEVLISDGFPPLRGKQRYRFGIYPHAGDWRAGDVPRRAHEFQDGPGVYRPGALLPLPFEKSFLKTGEGVILSAMHATEGQIRARFYDVTGENRRVRSEWEFPWKNVATVRLDGNREGDLTVQNGAIEFDLAKWKIVTIGEEARA